MYRSISIKQTVKQYLQSTVLLLLALFWGSNVLFTHTHVKEGRVIAHSHPYLPSSSHNHSTVEYNFLSGINLVSDIEVAHFNATLGWQSELRLSSEITCLSTGLVGLSALRAPPTIL